MSYNYDVCWHRLVWPGAMYSYNVVYKDEEDLMFDMDCDEIARRGSGYKYKSSECLCYNGAPHSAVLPGTVLQHCSSSSLHAAGTQ